MPARSVAAEACSICSTIRALLTSGYAATWCGGGERRGETKGGSCSAAGEALTSGYVAT